MKISNKILRLLFFALILCGCNKSTVPMGSGEDITIELDKKYIQFSSGISTRAALLGGEEQQYLDDDFAALGYQYRGEWVSAKLMAKPNVFYDANNVLALPQLVEYDSGIYTYDPIQAWTGNMYAFFGYYPYQHSTITLFDDGRTVVEGVPYITYNHPTDGDPTQLVDIMTASLIGTSIAFDSEVSMEMQHRLSAMDIRARNQYVYEEKVDELTTINHLVTIEITELVFKPRVYTKAKMYLDDPDNIVQSALQDLTYVLVDNTANTPTWAHKTFDVQPNTSEDLALRDITTSKGNNPTTILLIPQNTPMGGSLEFKYRMKYKDASGNFVYLNDHVSSYTADLGDFNRILEDGYQYYIEITFTSDAVSVNIVAADAWEEFDEDVELEFE